jgi:hypothetical protein
MKDMEDDELGSILFDIVGGDDPTDWDVDHVDEFELVE